MNASELKEKILLNRESVFQNKANMQKVLFIFFIETGLLYKLIDKLHQINGLMVY